MIFSVVIAAIGALFQFLQPKYASPAIPLIVLFFFFITLFTLFIVLRKPHQVSGKTFAAGYMLSRAIKFFSTIIFLVLYLILNKEDRMNFAIAFLIIYFSFSIFEVFALKKEQ
jgi:hypothetical protein